MRERRAAPVHLFWFQKEQSQLQLWARLSANAQTLLSYEPWHVSVHLANRRSFMFTQDNVRTCSKVNSMTGILQKTSALDPKVTTKEKEWDSILFGFTLLVKLLVLRKPDLQCIEICTVCAFWRELPMSKKGTEDQCGASSCTTNKKCSPSSSADVVLLHSLH